MGVVHETQVGRQSRQVAFTLGDALLGHADPQPVLVAMDGDAGALPEDAAQVISRALQLGGQLVERQAFGEARGQDLLGLLGQLALSPARGRACGLSVPAPCVSGRDDACKKRE